MSKNIILITSAAAHRINHLLAQDCNKPIGLSISIESGGCSGSKYKFEYVYQKKEFDEEVNDQGVKVFINPNAVLKIFGTKLDYIDHKTQSGFVFINPNEKGRCGCGESILL